jgi:hypothetical protein
MKTRRIPLAGAVIALAVGGLCIAQNEVKPEEPAQGPSAAPEEAPAPTPAAEETVDPSVAARQLVLELANEAYRAREEATKQLWDLGESGIEALEEGTENEDPEVAYRARILLQRIRTGITPATPPEIVELVQRYFRSDVTGKKVVFQKLSEFKAFLQMLRLYRFETDLLVRAECDEIMSKALLPAVVEELLEDRIDGAEELMRLAPATDQNCRRLAAFLRVEGKLDEEMRKTGLELDFDEKGDQPLHTRQMDAAALRLALLRSAGKNAEAKELAAKMGRDDLVASFALFEGDPLPYVIKIPTIDENFELKL